MPEHNERGLARRPIGTTGLELPVLGFGMAPIGDMPETYGRAVPEEDAQATVRAALGSPFPFIDTSRNYGMGRSEERVGRVLSSMNGMPPDGVLSTKLDRDENDRLDRDRARRSLEASFAALNVDSVDILHIHDPEHCRDVDEVVREAVPELFRMREEGLCRAVGLAAGRIDVMMPIVREFPFDCLITHNRWTLVNANARPLLELAAERGIAVINAAPFASGALVQGAAKARRYAYQTPTEAMLEPLRAVEAVCREHGVPLGAAALQHSLRTPGIASTLVGAENASEVEQAIEWAMADLPDALWAALDAAGRTNDDPEATRDYVLG